MAITFVGGGNNSGAGATKVVTLTPTSNCFAVAYLFGRTLSAVDSITDTQYNLWTKYSETGSSTFQSTWYAFLDASAVTITCNIHASVSGAFMVDCYSGANAITQFIANSGTGTAISAGSITTGLYDDAMIISCMGTLTNTPTITNPGGYTQEQSTGNVHGRMCDLFQTGVNTYTPQYSLNSSDSWMAATFAIQDINTNNNINNNVVSFGMNF
jgi:hypothetical protein